MNVTGPNIKNNLDGETTRNIDGKVYTITVSAADEVTVKDKFGQVFPARINKAAIIEADLSNSVAGANSMSVGGMNLSAHARPGHRLPGAHGDHQRSRRDGWLRRRHGRRGHRPLRRQPGVLPGGILAAAFLGGSRVAASSRRPSRSTR